MGKKAFLRNSNNSWKRVLGLGGLSIIFIFMMGILSPVGLNANPIQTNNLEVKSATLLYSLPISIGSNIDFANQALANGWGGAGTEADPYIVQDLQIDMSTNPTYGIAIANTNCYFILQDILVDCTGTCTAGIYLNGVTNGTIKNCTVVACGIGILVSGSSDAIENTSVQSCNSGNGISVTGSFDTISNNQINSICFSSGNGYGIWLSGSNNNAFNNTISAVYGSNSINSGYTTGNANGIGIGLSGSSNYVFNNSINGITGGIFSGSGMGIYLSSASSNTISNNSINNINGWSSGNYGGTYYIGTGGNAYGLYLSASSSNNLANNTIRGINGGSGGIVGLGNGNGGSGFGVSLSSSSLNNVTNNSISGINGGGSVGGSRGSAYGISVSANSNNITNNTVGGINGAGAIGWGIYPTGASFTTISNNQIYSVSGGSAYGLDLSSSPNNAINNNTVTGLSGSSSACGFYFSSASANVVYNNTVSGLSGSSVSGASLYSSSCNNTLLSNVDNNHIPISVYADGSSAGDIFQSTFALSCANVNWGTGMAQLIWSSPGSSSGLNYAIYASSQYITTLNDTTTLVVNTNKLWSYVYVSGEDEFFAIVASNPNSSVMSNTLEIKLGTTINETIILWNNPISISSNTDFATQALTNRWAGDGSSGNPYVIQDLQIDMSSNPTYGIAVANTNCYFVLQGILVNCAGTCSAGIYLNGVTNGTITNCTVIGCGVGILVSGSSNAIANTSVQSCSSGNGISVTGSFETINGNLVNSVCFSSGNGNGILVTGSNNNVFNNTISAVYGANSINSGYTTGNANGIGIDISGSANYVFNNSINGITGGIFYGSGMGIYLSSASSNTVSNNSISNINGYSDGNHGGTIYIGGGGNAYGIYLSASSSNNIANNSIHGMNGGSGGVAGYGSGNGGSGFGVSLSSTSLNNVTNNSISGINGGGSVGGSRGSAYGVSVSANSNNITNNTLSGINGGGAIGCGIYLTGASFTTVYNNQIYSVSGGSAYGLDLSSSSSNTINNNTINGLSGSSSACGFYFSSASANVVYNNTVSGLSGSSVSGASLYSSSCNNTLLYNVDNNHNPISVYADGSSAGNIFQTTFLVSFNNVNLRTGMVQLAWASPGSSSGITYSIYKSLQFITTLNSTTTWVANTTNLWVNFLALAAAVQYFVVVASNPTCVGVMSNTLELDASVPSASTLSQAFAESSTNGTFSLSWTASANAYNYTIIQNGAILMAGLTNLSVVLSNYADGTYQFVVNATNYFGNTSSNTVEVAIQRPLTPDLTAISPNPSSSSHVTLSWSAVDNQLGSCVYVSTSPIDISNIRNLSPIVITNLTTYEDTEVVDGTYYYVVTAFNQGGASAPSTCRSVIVDTIAPVVSNVARNPAAPNNTHSFDVSATVTDATSGVATADLYYRVNSGTWQKVAMAGASSTYSGTIPTQAYNAFVEYYVNGTDVAGNWAASGTSSCTILDGVPPSISYLGRNSTAVNCTQCAEVQATISDADSGMGAATLHYRVNGGAWQQVPMAAGAPFTGVIPAQAYYALVEYYVNATDASLNWVASSVQSYRVTEQTPPEITNENRDPSAPTTAHSFEVSATVTDAFSSVATANIYYRVDAGEWFKVTMTGASSTYTGTIPTQAYNAFVEYYVNATDVAGNWLVSDTSSCTILDGAAPAISDLGRNSTVVNCTQCAEVQATISDADSGMGAATLYYRVNGGAWQQVPMAAGAPFTGVIPAQAYYALVEYYVNATDASLNWVASSVQSYRVTEDIPPVVTNVLRNPSAPTNAHSFDVCATVTDAISGVAVADLYYHVNSGSWHKVPMAGASSTYSGTIPLQAFNSFVEYYVNGTDLAGNWAVSGTSSCTILDGVPPSISNLGRNSTAVNCTQDAEVHATVSDADSDMGAATVYHRVDGGAWQQVAMAAGTPYTGVIPVQAYGALVEYYVNATDAAGNWVASVVQSYRVTEQVPPVITNVIQTPSAPTNAHSFDVSAAVTDAISGVASAVLYYRVNSGTWKKVAMAGASSAYAATIPAQAYNSFVEYYVNATDAAGNWQASQAGSCTVRDGISPVMVTVVRDISSPNSTQPVLISVAVTDADSGIATVDLMYRVNGSSWIKIAMVLSNARYSAAIPAQGNSSIMEYYVNATDAAGNSVISEAGSFTVVQGGAVPNQDTGWVVLAVSITVPIAAFAAIAITVRLKKLRAKRG